MFLFCFSDYICPPLHLENGQGDVSNHPCPHQTYTTYVYVS